MPHQTSPEPSFPGIGRALGSTIASPNTWERRFAMLTNDDDTSTTDSSPPTDRRFLDVPQTHQRRNRPRSFHTPEERERRRSYYTVQGFVPQSSSQEDLAQQSSRRFFVSESDSDQRLNDLLRASQDVRTRRSPLRYRRERTFSQPARSPLPVLATRSRTNSDSNSDDGARPSSVYSSCSSVNEIVDRFKNYNRRVRDMVISSFADLDDGGVVNRGTSTSRQPQLCFHSVHGQNITLQDGGRIARRSGSFCKGIAFSNRPITIDEVVCLRFNEVASNWSGCLRLGVTNDDPEIYRNATVPKFVCPDLTSKEEYWAKALPERYAQEGNVIHFFVTSGGELHYGVNGAQKGLFLSGINVRLPLYVILDIYGNSKTIEFIDGYDAKLRASRAISNDIDRPPLPTNPPAISPSQPTPSTSTANDANIRDLLGELELDLMQFHVVTGRHIRLNTLRTMATRSEQEYTQGYVFTNRTVRLNEKVFIQIAGIYQVYHGSLAFGVTCANPQSLLGKDLPDDSSDLVDMADYFVCIKDVALNPAVNSILSFWITPEGEVKFQKDQRTPRTIVHVDATLPLYMFFDVYGQTQCIKLLGCCPVSRAPSVSTTTTSMPTRVALPVLPPTTSARTRPIASPSAELRVALDSLRVADATSVPARPAPAIPPRRAISGIDDLLLTDNSSSNSVPIAPSSAGPSQFSLLNSNTTRRPPPITPRQQTTRPPPVPPTKPTLPSTPIADISAPRTIAPPPPRRVSPTPVTASANSNAPGGDSDDLDEGEECTVCMNAKINCVIYKCGHMCMCYNCAITLRDQKGECPMCRVQMLDVIKCFRS